jgi:DNA repair exonuclease SbcCD ATPase subunit
MNLELKKYKDLKEDIISRRANKESLERMVASYRADADALQASIQTLGDSVTLMQAFSGTLRSDVVQKFEGLLTKGVRQIFNKDYQISIEFSNSGNSVYADFYITLPDGKKVTLANGEGGGLRDFVSVLQRILYIILEPSRPSKVLFLDECFKALDAGRAPGAFRFISELCRELDIQVVFITHSPAAKDLVGNPGVSVLEVFNDGSGSQVRRAGC